ncbi:MAG: hypothetical protein ABWK01_02280, partial [Infirmifilum sp.]
ERAEKTEGVVAGSISVELRVSKGIVELGSVQVPCEVYTTVAARKSLVGRQLLNRYRVVLEAPCGLARLEEATCTE